MSSRTEVGAVRGGVGLTWSFITYLDEMIARYPPSLMVTTSHECIILTFLAI